MTRPQIRNIVVASSTPSLVKLKIDIPTHTAMDIKIVKIEYLLNRYFSRVYSPAPSEIYNACAKQQTQAVDPLQVIAKITPAILDNKGSELKNIIVKLNVNRKSFIERFITIFPSTF